MGTGEFYADAHGGDVPTPADVLGEVRAAISSIRQFSHDDLVAPEGVILRGTLPTPEPSASIGMTDWNALKKPDRR